MFLQSINNALKEKAMMNNQEREHLEININETQHYRDISDEIMNYITLAENASLITLNGLSDSKEPIQINETRGLVLLLLAKAAKNIRLAAIGLRLGYYSGVSAIIRSALESLSFATLFDSEPNQIDEWFINEFSQKSKSEKNTFYDNQTKSAKEALLDFENDRLAIKDAMHEFLEKANQSLHTSMRGLSEEFGVDIESLLPDDFQLEYEKSGFDFNKAISKFACLRRFGKNIISGQAKDEENELVEISLSCAYNESNITDLALFNFYVAHRVLDSTKLCFDVKDEEFKEQYNLWHKEIKETH